MRPAPIIALIGLSWPAAAAAQEMAQDPIAGFHVLDALDACGASRPAEEIVVCGNRRDRDRYRLPNLGGRRSAGTGYVRGEVPRASADPAAFGPCGIFQGQRPCSEAEMAEFGYGAGRDPITAIANLMTRLADPDADIGPPPSIPE